MKNLFLLLPLVAACGLLGGGKDGGSAPKEREEAVSCPDAEQCAGKYKSGVVCLPSGEHHSSADKCPLKK